MIVDASVWVSALVAQDAGHSASLQWLRERMAAGGALIVPALALAEVAGAIARRTGSSSLGRQATQEIRQALGLQVVSLDAELGAAAAVVAADLHLRGADAVYVAVAHTLNVPLITWEQELRTRAAGLVEVLHP